MGWDVAKMLLGFCFFVFKSSNTDHGQTRLEPYSSTNNEAVRTCCEKKKKKKKKNKLMKDKQYRKAKTCSRNFLIWSFQITSFWGTVDRKHSRASSRISSVCLWSLSVFVTPDPTPTQNLPLKNEEQNYFYYLPGVLWCLEVLCWYLCVISKQSIASVLWNLPMHILIFLLQPT